MRILLWGLLYSLSELSTAHISLFRPMAGVAVAAFVLSGVSAWPAIFLGSLGSGLLLGHGLEASILEASVATLQGLLAFYLVRRFLGLPISLFKMRSLALFSLLIGPVSALAGTCSAAACVWLASLPTTMPFLRFVAFGWVARTVGAVVITPVLLCLFSDRYPWTRRRTSVALPMLLCLAIAFYGRYLVQRDYDRLMQLSLERQADSVEQALEEKLGSFQDMLNAVAGLFQASVEVSSAEFETFVSAQLQRHSRPLALGWVPASKPGSLALSQVYPLEGNEQLLGFDLASDPVLEREFQVSGSQGTASLTPPLKHFVPGYSEDLILMMLPVYSRNAQDLKPLDRPKHLLGYVVGFYSVQNIVAAANSALPDSTHYLLKLYHGPAAEHEYLIEQVGSPPPFSSGGVSRTLSTARSAGTDWTIHLLYRILRADRPQFRLPLVLLVLALLQAFLILLSSRTTLIEQLKREGEARTDNLRELNEKLRNASEVAREAEIAKGMFLANMSHEIRTPMNGILGLTRLVLDSDLKPAQREQLRHVVFSAEGLLSILNDVLDFSKIEAGELDLYPQPTPLSPLLEQSTRMVCLQAEEKGLELYLDIDPEVPEEIVVDGNRLRQILINLLGNAVKFTKEGDVRLGVAVASREQTQLNLCFTVTDTGIGISQSQLREIFEPFAQADPRTSGHHRGTGLGLSISQRLVELMGGRLTAESAPSVGSSFTFTLPCQTPSSAPLSFDESLQGKPVWLDIEHAPRREVLKRRLLEWGFSIARDRSAAQLSIIEESTLLKTPPGTIPTVVILSATNVGTLFDFCGEQGMIPVVRPVVPQSLFAALSRALGSPTPPEPSVSPSDSHKPFEGKRCLVVDDNATNRLLATLLLNRLGFETSEATSGTEALAALSRQTPDLVLMDVRMPELDGYEATLKIRELGIQVPILAVSASISDIQKQRAYEAGMNGFITKPVSKVQLLEVIRSAFSGAAPTPPELQHLHRSVDGDEDSMRAVIASFLNELPALRQSLETLSQPEKVALAAHTLRGSLELFGSSQLIERLRAIELEANANHTDLQEIALVIRECDKLAVALKTYLKESGYAH